MLASARLSCLKLQSNR